MVGCVVSDVSKRRSGAACPRCKTSMREVTTVAPLLTEPGLIAYECHACNYVMSVILPAGKANEDAR